MASSPATRRSGTVASAMGLFRRAPNPTDIERMKADVVALREAMDERDEQRRIAELVARLDAIDARVTAVSTELANQLNELGGELDALAARPDDGAVEQLRTGQVRLASEQARYQIAFRQDLAELAETLRR